MKLPDLSLMLARFLVLLTAWFAAGFLLAEEPVGEVRKLDFARDVYPIFAQRCQDCHGEQTQEGQLRLDARAIALRGGVSGPAVVPGHSDQSLLIKRLTGDSEGERMPPDEEPLTERQIAILRRWIDQGAKWPTGVGSEVTSSATHWSYQAAVRPELPAVRDRHWPRNPLDYFILARIEQEGLPVSAPAERAVLLRRVYLDLIGIPPAPDELNAFLEEPDETQAYERVVDRLLASPRYGERWARPWLDLARYADSNGYQADQYRSVWPYRDWVIRALNADMPFDQFTIEQMAGDLLPDATRSQKIATGFHRLTTCNVEAGVDPEENRIEQVFDRVNTTGTVWLGTSIECAQCHNHKYDPFTQRDYYRLFAYFNNTPLEVEGNGVTYNFTGPKMPLPLNESQQEAKEQLEQELADATQSLQQSRRQALAGFDEWTEQMKTAAESESQWHVLQVEDFSSSNGATAEVLEDQSVLLSGKNPDIDVYTVQLHTNVTEPVTGIQLETLTHESLPGQGPGRHDAERPNFVLHEFQVFLEQADGSRRPVPLHSATADFSQKRFDVAGAIDGKSDTAWAINPQFHKPHHASFLLREPLTMEPDDRLIATLDQHYGGGRTIGRLRLSAMTGAPSSQQLPTDLAKFLRQDQRTDAQTKKLTDFYLKQQPEFEQATKRVESLRKQIAKIEPVTTLVMVESESRKTHIFERGNFLTPGEEVVSGTPSILHELSGDAPANRLGLAKWLVDPANPLVSRVTVNRWWSQFFGQGLVASLEDFGSQGERPTHPALLDWLACELVECGWSMKQIHRLIVTSATYRQSSRFTSELLERDPENRLYARGPRFRMSAEMIRDQALTVAGVLSRQMAGPPVFPPQPPNIWRHVGRNAPKYDTSTDQNRFRRGIYVFWRRSAPYPSFTNFDAPDRSSCMVARPRTNTPLQALTLLNDQAYVELALALARRALLDLPDAAAEQRVEHLFRCVLVRAPSPFEREHLVQVWTDERERLAEDPSAARLLLANLPALRSEGQERLDPVELAAWFYVANILLNLDETITKG